ncbi:MAG: DUF2726 domain-containing protein [Magnetococcus sp. THC-1_WYH]
MELNAMNIYNLATSITAWAFILEPIVAKVIKIRRHANFDVTEINWTQPLTKPEQILYRRLINVFPDHIILSQVSLGRFLYANSGNPKKDLAMEETFRQKMVDFLVCDKEFNIISAIELDDGSHDKRKDKKRDLIFFLGGIRIVRWNVEAIPNEYKIRDDLLS